LDVLPTLEAGSVDAVIVDLPYFEIAPHEWDRQWEDRAAYIEWIVRLAHEWKRITKDNSSIFLFADEKTEAYIQVRLDEMFLLLNKIVWFKRNNLPQKNAHLLRSFAPMTERALFYTTQYDATGWESVKLDVNNFGPLREYFRQFQEALGLNIKQINSRLGHRRAEHAFYWGTTQWDLPMPDTYAELLTLPRNGFIVREYEDLRREYSFVTREYEDLRREYEDLRRPFNADARTWDVIEFPIVGADDNTDHPTTKPLELMGRIVSVITNPDQVILDCCAGSGTTGVAAVKLGRRFIGIEIHRPYFDIAVRRIEQAERQLSLFAEQP
jgi:site-specific DNA-methyltransferase (adenine-specific)